MRWKAVYNLEEIGCFDTFEKAFTAIYHTIKKEEVLTWQLLETTIWLISDKPTAAPIFFYEARDMACQMGILKDGKLTKEN